MAKKRLSGLDELMIVNPGLPNMERELPLSQVFLGEDGRLYRLEGLQKDNPPSELAEFYLGGDGTLYRLEHFGPLHEPYLRGAEEVRNPHSRYFLGEDGTLYKAIRS